ncbi:MAG: CHC2 zinc finger domain-containing protein [Cytophagaceae bacterium]
MEISEIKSRLTLAEVIKHYGFKADKHNRICCPFHDDKTPSMQLYWKTHTAYCFSSNCKTHGKSMDVIDFIMHKENCTKAEAIKKAIELSGGENSPAKTTKPENPTVKPTISREQILQNMFTYFKNAVHNSKPAQDYIAGRGLDATRIEVGYNTAQFHHGARKDETLINNCVAVGLLSPWGTSKTGEQAYKPFAKYCISFALRDRGNHITGLYFRSTVNEDNNKHFYLKESTGLYPKYPDPDTEKLIITESVIDTASLLQIEAISKEYTLLAAYGTNRLTPEHVEAIKELKSLKEIIFAFDNDEAGGTATAKYSNELKALMPGVSFSKIELPCKDVNETLQAHQPEIFLHLIENRTFLLSSEQSNEKEKIQSSESTVKPMVEQEAKPNANLNTSNPNKIIYATETATYYILGGLPKQLDHLKIMLSVENKQGFKSRNKVDLYEDKQVERLCKDVSEKLQIRKDLMEKDIYRLTELAETFRESEQGENKAGQGPQPTQHFFTLKERTELENFLKKPRVIKRLNEMLGKTGIVGEERNRIFLMLIAISYKMKDPLHSLIQGSSGSGKTKIVRQVSDCIPQESVTRFTRISDKALYNYPKNYFTNRLLIIEDVDGLSEDAEMAFRELQSSGELRSSVSIKLENGSITGGEKVVSGPIASMSCTTKGEVYEDNMSRVFLIAVDESMEQTKRIIQYQNAKASGKIDSKEEQKAKTFIQNLIRIIEAREVINPFAEKIQLPEEAHKIRRLNDLFQNFIKMVTLINQYQRKKTEQGKLIAEIGDVETAIEIMFESIVLKVDELDGSLRQFFENLKSYLQKNYKDNYSKVEFTQREVRQGLHISKAQINRYLQNLTELEYIQQNGFANKGFRYKIAYWDNYEALRKRIKENLTNQIAELKVRATSEPLQSR